MVAPHVDELVIVDTGSTAETLGLLAELARRAPRSASSGRGVGSCVSPGVRFVMMSRRRSGSIAVAVLASLAVSAGASPVTASTAATGTLEMGASLSLVSNLGGCEPTGGADECAARTISGAFPGLGRVDGAYSFVVDLGQPSCANDVGKALAYPIRITVAGKGEIQLAVAEGAKCIEGATIKTQGQAFTVTGGTGIYVGASGSGTLQRTLADSGHGTETWAGTLNVPGLDFDVVPPVFVGAVTKVVKARRGAKSVRVSYRVSATDSGDAAVNATCKPASGSRFAFGRTRVTCEASDSS